MTLVTAALSVCLLGQLTACETHQFRIDPRACGLSYRAEIPWQGAWQPAVARIVCER